LTLTASEQHHVVGESRVRGPGSRRGRGIAALALALAAILVALGLVSAATSTAAHSRAGQIPSWLPNAKPAPVGVAEASFRHPQLAIQGDTIAITTPSGRVLATVVGPAVPKEGGYPVPSTTPCTFTVALHAVSGSFAILPINFTILDEQNTLHFPNVTTDSGAAVPKTLHAGQSVTLVLNAVLAVGNGDVRWSPLHSSPVATWDFAVEID